MEDADNTPRFVDNGRKRSEVVTLDWPIQVGDAIVNKITVSRMTGSQVDAFVEAVRTNGAKTPLPMFDVPPEVIDALDADDATKLNEVVGRLLPRALALAPDETPLQTPEAQ